MRSGLIVLMVFFAACGTPPPADDGEGDPDSPDAGAVTSRTDEDGGSMTGLTVGGTARVNTDSLNLRDGIGTGANILTAMPCGATVTVVGGPSTTPAAGWWNVTYEGQTGWASGKYLVADGAFAGSCGAPSDGGVITGTDVAAMFDRAKLAVGYSYYWGHGSWRADHATLGACMGTCPSCSHNGAYGADCSGFISKVWQVPTASALETDEHPYSTYNFYNETTHWKPVPRSSMQPGDALVRRSSTSGHIALVESVDASGQVWVYEARGCSTGVVHDLRAFDTSYIAIRRDGL